jgi:hypothetical protein
MALRGKICVVHGERDGIDLATLDCRTHRHERRSDVDAMIATGTVEWIQPPTNRKEKSVVRFLKTIPHQRGLSCKIGEYAAGAVRAKETWALTMLSDIRVHAS